MAWNNTDELLCIHFRRAWRGRRGAEERAASDPEAETCRLESTSRPDKARLVSGLRKPRKIQERSYFYTPGGGPVTLPTPWHHQCGPCRADLQLFKLKTKVVLSWALRNQSECERKQNEARRQAGNPRGWNGNSHLSLSEAPYWPAGVRSSDRVPSWTHTPTHTPTPTPTHTIGCLIIVSNLICR